jgi:hypothetical protein
MCFNARGPLAASIALTCSASASSALQFVCLPLSMDQCASNFIFDFLKVVALFSELAQYPTLEAARHGCTKFASFVILMQVAARLRNFAIIRTLEMKIAASTATSGRGELATAVRVEEAAVQSARLGESCNPCKLRLRIAQVASSLLHLSVV